MPCKNVNHSHVWATEGAIVIERCEKICFFCNKELKHAWFLRRHVTNVHCKQYPGLIVLKGWKNSPNGNRRPNSPEKRGRSSSRTPSGASRASSLTVHSEASTPPQIIDAVNTAEIVPFVGTMAAEDLFFPNPNLDLPRLFSDVLPELGTTSSFVTPQSVRVTGGVIEGVMPSVDHHGAAETFAEGLNSIVGSILRGGEMTAEEILYVLETFTGTFKVGLGMPFAGL